MITSDGGYMVYSQDTPGGSYLQDHEAMFNMYIGKYAFSHVILQGQSYEPIDKKEAFLETMEKFGKQAKAIGAQVIVYESWAYDRESYKGLTRYEMTEQLKLSYEGRVFWINRSEIGNYVVVDGFMEMLEVFENDNLSENYHWLEDGIWKVQNK
jgi:hypothetical protein